MIPGLKSLFGPVLLVAATTVSTVPAQPPPTEQLSQPPPTERVIEDYGLRYDLPLHPCLLPAIAQQIARSARVPMGLEKIPQVCQLDGWAPAQATDELVLSGLTVGEALDRLVQLDPRYVWFESDGVIVIRPLAAWVDDDHFLHRSLPAFSVTDQQMHGALAAITNALGPHQLSAGQELPARTPEGDRRFTVELGATSVIESLDAVVRAHGAMWWMVTYCRPPARYEHATIYMHTFDGTGLGRHQTTRRDDGTWFSPCVSGSGFSPEPVDGP